MRTSLRALFRSIAPIERKIVLAAAATVMVVTSIPPLVGWATAAHAGKLWLGRPFLAPADLPVYLSYIDQAKSGAALIRDLYTTEPLQPSFNLLWYAVGRLAAAFSLSPLAAFHAARLLLIPPLAIVSYLAIAWFLADRRERIAAYLLFMFGSGLGAFVAPFLAKLPPSAGTYRWPIDFWVGEANAFMTMGYSPHFVASLALWLCSVLLLAIAYEKRSLPGAAAAGLSACALFGFHPYHVPVIYAIAAAWCLLLGLRHGWRKAPWLESAAFVGVSAPGAAYQYFSVYSDPAAIAHAMTNLTLTPPLFFVLIGFGAISVLWIPGARSAARSGAIPRDRLAMLVVWVAVQGLLLYAPFRFQRRFLEGLQFPLTVLAVPALFDLHARLSAWRRFGKEAKAVAGILALAAVFLVSTALAASRNLDLSSDPSDPDFFMDKTQADAERWFRSHTPSDAAVMTAAGTGNFFVPTAGRRAYAGHWSETIDIADKTDQIAWFYRDADDLARAAFMRAHGLAYVYFGQAERALGGPSFGASFDRVYDEAGIEIFVLKAARP